MFAAGRSNNTQAVDFSLGRKKCPKRGKKPRGKTRCRKVKSLPFPKRQILDSPKLKDFADDNFRFNDNGRKFSK